MKKEFIKEISESHYPVEMWETSKGCFDDMNEGDRNTFKEGFDAAIALELPVKFLEWCANNSCWRNGKEGSTWYSISYKFEKELTTIELYQYWIENIYKH